MGEEEQHQPFFPNLFVETVQPTIASIMIFAMADLRRIAREDEAAAADGEGSDNNDSNHRLVGSRHSTRNSGNCPIAAHTRPLKVLDLPITGQEMVKFCRDNEDVLKTRVRSNEYNTVEYLLGEFYQKQNGRGVVNPADVVIHHFGDDNALHECVHAVITNSKRKQIILTFRGSITMQDWITDAKLMSGDIANPLYREYRDDTSTADADKNKESYSEYLGVHLGFRDYLYDVRDPLLSLPSLRDLHRVISKAIPTTALQDSSSVADKDSDNDNSNCTPSSLVDKKSTSSLPTTSKDPSSSRSRESQWSIGGEQEPKRNKIDVILDQVQDQVQELLEDNPDQSSMGEQEEPKRNKIDVILDQVQELLDENPDYKVYITGHSLGGALALLTSVEATVRFAKPGVPVTCVTIANPRVGDNRFRSAIQTLEQHKKLRCLTVHNLLDLVPSMPSRICRCDFCRPNKFCMPGMQLVLKDHSFATIYHSEEHDTRWGEFSREFQRFLIVIFCCCQMARQHDYRTYLDRLVEQEDALSKLYLNDLYSEQGIDFDSC